MAKLMEFPVMNRSFLVSIMVLITVGLVQNGAHAQHEIALAHGPTTLLSIVDGAVVPVTTISGGHYWSLSVPGIRGGTTTIHIVSEDKWNGMYLAYDKKGKRTTVYLSKDPAVWKLTFVGGVCQYTLQATKGKYKDWYLTVRQGGKQGGRQVVLTRKPKRLSQFAICELSR
jgi:hypothetical protein